MKLSSVYFKEKKWDHFILNLFFLSVGTLQSLCQGIICSSLPCPSQWCDAGGAGNIILLFSLMWWVLLWVGKRCSELICILRLQTDQWLLSKGDDLLWQLINNINFTLIHTCCIRCVLLYHCKTENKDLYTNGLAQSSVPLTVLAVVTKASARSSGVVGWVCPCSEVVFSLWCLSPIRIQQ